MKKLEALERMAMARTQGRDAARRQQQQCGRYGGVRRSAREAGAGGLRLNKRTFI